MSEEITLVKGHTCEGLQQFFSAITYGCIPGIYEDGRIHGCDDNNPVAIIYCPFCGIKLSE